MRRPQRPRLRPAVKTAPRNYIHLWWKVRLRGLLSVSLRDDLKNHRGAIPQGTHAGGFITNGDPNLAAVLTAGSIGTREGGFMPKAFFT